MSTEEAKAEEDVFNIDERRRLKHIAYVTSGCGKNKEKDRAVAVFWEETWPRLVKLGWKKVEDEGRNVGSVSFFPSGVAESTGEKGRDYYDRIKDVLDRLREKRTLSEGTIIEEFDAEVYHREQDEIKSSRKRKSEGASTTGGSASAVKSPKLEPWKEGRKFVKKSSRVGPEYQVSKLPDVGEKPEVEPDLVWSPLEAAAAGLKIDPSEDMISSLPPHKKFEALCMLAERGYEVEGFEEVVNALPTTDGSDWEEGKKQRFSKLMFAKKKNLSAVCKTMGIDMKSCLIYYYREFKNSTDYRLMKAIVDDERYEKTARFETHSDVCAVCDDGGELVICDECEGEYHLKCIRPPLKIVPEGRWECDECVDRKLLQLRNYLLHRTLLAKETQEEEGDSPKKEFRPSDKALEAVRTFSLKITKLLAPTDMEGEVEVKAEEVGDDEED